ncbi:4,5-DOPA dioxygenase extradiol [Lishizhenia tianjinensis]|uniref:4,5-DOPA dioxygenase extradiol n=1 Tax=Lishizhenia tianjinensis TaxID=477690 RepID=A0A1I6XQS0_9FLAO|nr:class III extradiol ring-cleavage dioxygenase [Lishizhenia tianjinensis]SFT40251.1 4,5-DOPA dioxygenase extradiol [Lishizhenia tianjinensis]
MKRNDFIKSTLALSVMSNLGCLNRFAEKLPLQSKKMPVLFTSHGNPMDIPLSKEERPFWNTLFNLGKDLKANYDVKAALVVSAHWCTRGTFVNSSLEQEQIYDYYGFPEHYYDPKYKAFGAPEIAQEIHELIPEVKTTDDWGLDHGAWPMLMHLFPEGDVPVFQMSLDYYADPSYHYELGKQLATLRQKGVLIIGSGSLIHNLQLAMSKMQKNDMSPYCWEAEYDYWLKQQIDQRNFENLIKYQSSHKLGKLAAPTPDHFVPILYTLGLTTSKDSIEYFYEGEPSIPAFSERSFIVSEKG